MERINKKDILIIAIIIFTIIVYVSLIFNDSVWQDEAFTMNILRKDFIGIARATAGDVHPPLYYCIAKIFTIIFGYSVPVVKIVSIIPVILSMILVWIKARKLFSSNYISISVIFSLLIGFIPVAFVQNIELRMYTWAMLFTTCSGIYAYELYLNPKSKKNIALFIIAGLCAAYTHYYAAVTECFIYLFLIISLILKHKAWKEILIIVSATIALYLPWLPIFIRQFIVVRDYWWLEIFNFETIIDIIKYPFKGQFVYIFLTITAISIISGIIHIVKKEDGEVVFSLLCILSCILMVTLGCIVSFLLRPIYVTRYTYVAIGLVFLGISIILSKVKYGKAVAIILIALIAINFPISYKTAYIKEYDTGTEEFKKFAKDNIKEEITIITESNDLAHTLPYYLPNNNLKWGYITENARGYVFSEKTLEEMKEIIPNATIQELFNGSIDGFMKFSVYWVK